MQSVGQKKNKTYRQLCNATITRVLNTKGANYKINLNRESEFSYLSFTFNGSSGSLIYIYIYIYMCVCVCVCVCVSKYTVVENTYIALWLIDKKTHAALFHW